MEKMHYIRDPIHGYISLNQIEYEIINTSAFQRLRHIRQLGLTDLVYPGATHNRFSHSLGVMHLAERVLRQIFSKVEVLNFSQNKKEQIIRIMRIAGLLHDLGHPPFSHALENFFEDNLSHEEMTKKIIEETEIGEIILKYGKKYEISILDILNIISSTPSKELSFLKELLSSELDIDKMDYLMRDSLYCGVRYGIFDLERLIYTIALIPKDDSFYLGVEESGIHSLEAFVLARYYMFSQVYFNPISKVLELHLSNFFNDKNIYWPSDVKKFISLDDNWVFYILKENKDHPDAKAVLSHKQYPLIYETKEHMEDEEEKNFMNLIERFQKENPNWKIFVSLATKDPHHFSKSNIYLIDSFGNISNVEKKSSFLCYLKKINQFRVYTKEKYEKKVKKWFEENARDCFY